jgi:hypothetical protein
MVRRRSMSIPIIKKTIIPKEINAKAFNVFGSLLLPKIIPIPEIKIVTVKNTINIVTQT